MITDSERLAMDYAEDAAAQPREPRWPLAKALGIAEELRLTLEPACVPGYCIIAGSVRRRKPDVGDIEILYVPRIEERPNPQDMFRKMQMNLADQVIAYLERAGELTKRRNVKGRTMFGPKNKYMEHRRSGIPVDLFATTEAGWFSALVCRTGPSDLNVRIATEARKRGWNWNPYGTGFSRGGPLAGQSETHAVQSEREVFEFVGLPYREPWERR